MTPNFTILEKVISIILILWASFWLYGTYLFLTNLFDMARSSSGVYVISYSKLFNNYSLSIIGNTCTIVGGILLLFNKKPGWIISLISSLSYCLIFVVAAIKSASSPKETLAVEFGRIILIILMLSMFIILLLQPFRIKYRG